ncbi:MAG: hypothetical protein MUD09_09935 [Desulfobacterales bacterium]|jgi:hypothetical protein|nr:hypothetical protein [Desulfobacterales bacterium]
MLTLTIAMALGKSEVNKVGGGWTCPQIISLAIFLVMLYTWITENNLILQLNGSYLVPERKLPSQREGRGEGNITH